MNPQPRKQSTTTLLLPPGLAGMILVALLAAFLRLLGFGAQSIAFDEGYSLAVGSADWPTLFQATLSSGVHPPFFYILYKIVLPLWGTSEFGARFIAVVFGLLAVPLTYRLGALLFDRRVGWLAAALLALNPIHVWLSQEARMYALLIALSLADMLCFWQALRRPRQAYWLGLMALHALIFNLHFFGLKFDPTFQKDHWREVAAFIDRYEQPGDVILLYSTHLRFPFDYYYHGDSPEEPISLNLNRYSIESLVAGRRQAWVIYPYTRRPTHYPRQPLLANGYWADDPDRNPLLVNWLDTHSSNVVDYRHFLGIQLWLVDLPARLEVTNRG
jgi:hypothetical protein